MRILAIIFFVGSMGALGGCTTPLGISNYQEVAVVSTHRLWANKEGPSFNAEYSPPAYFTVSLETVIATYGKRCRATYHCSYFADKDSYYLLEDYGVVPSFSIPTHAVIIVDGRTGKLLKGQ